jgi:hypothetical protein
MCRQPTKTMQHATALNPGDSSTTARREGPPGLEFLSVKQSAEIGEDLVASCARFIGFGYN